VRWWRAGGCDSGAEGRAGIQAGFKKRFEAITRAKGVAATVLCLSGRGRVLRFGHRCQWQDGGAGG